MHKLLTSAVALSLVPGPVLAQDYPTKDIQGIIQGAPAARPIP